MIDKIESCLFVIVPLGAICACNYFIGRSWVRLDRNPWTGKFLGGTFSAPNPGWNPGSMDLDEIHDSGRRLMTFAPVIFLAVAAVTTIFVFAN
jgi:hypothetical protein